jgi:hypothetical protein
LTRKKSRDGKIIEGIDKIEMASLVERGITKIIIIEIMEINKKGI